jgi:hypothetical protein
MNDDQLDLLANFTDADALQFLLADLHDDLKGRLTRLRMLIDLGTSLGLHGTMIYGGQAAALAYQEARSSFVNGNFIATIFLCQSLIENVLAAYVHAGLQGEEHSQRVQFSETIARCQMRGLLDERDATDLLQLSRMRNPLIHFRSMDDPEQLDRRSIDAKEHAMSLLAKDAYFAMGMAIRLLAKPPFRIG